MTGHSVGRDVGLSPGQRLAGYLAPHYWDADYPLWLNLGYWRDAYTYPEAGQQMARKVADLADLGPGDTVLDVGCGFLEPARFWLHSNSVTHVMCVTNDAFQYRIATHRLRRWREDRISVLCCDATSITRHFADIDVVVALESAFQFNTRAQFFRDVLQVLGPTGRLATADLVSTSGQVSSEDSQAACRQAHRVPEANVYDRDIYVRLLEETGFRRVAAESIASDVYRGVEGFLASLPLGEELSEHVLSAGGREGAGTSWWGTHGGLGDFILCSAQKGRL